MGGVNATLYTWAYQQLNRCTPLRYDCGRLCDRICCRGEDGMWLFPGEEELLRAEPSFTIEPLKWGLSNGRQLYWLTCTGQCHRELRPLSCRIFPLGPYLKRDLVTVAIDPRAKGLCPLAEGRHRLQREFFRTVGRVCRELAREPELKEFIGIWTEEMEDYHKIRDLFG
jgi:hypothetical protein